MMRLFYTSCSQLYIMRLLDEYIDDAAKRLVSTDAVVLHGWKSSNAFRVAHHPISTSSQVADAMNRIGDALMRIRESNDHVVSIVCEDNHVSVYHGSSDTDLVRHVREMRAAIHAVHPHIDVHVCKSTALVPFASMKRARMIYHPSHVSTILSRFGFDASVNDAWLVIERTKSPTEYAVVAAF